MTNPHPTTNRAQDNGPWEVSLTPAGLAIANVREDAELVRLWRAWREAEHAVLTEEASSEADQATEGAYERQDEIEAAIFQTPAKGAVGVAVKLALWRAYNFPNPAFELDAGERAVASALEDTLRLAAAIEIAERQFP